MIWNKSKATPTVGPVVGGSVRKPFSLILSVGLLTLPALAKIPDQGALFSLTRFDGDEERKLVPGEKLAAGTKLRLHMRGIHQACAVLALPFQRGKARALDPLVPTVTFLNPDEESEVDYTLQAPIKPGELFIVVVPRQSPTADDLTRLLGEWKTRPKESQGPRTALHDRFSDWLARRDKSLTYAGPVPKELGGVRINSAQSVNPAAVNMEASGGGSKGKANSRGVFKEPYPWRNQANWLPCSSAQPGVFVYALGK